MTVIALLASGYVRFSQAAIADGSAGVLYGTSDLALLPHEVVAAEAIALLERGALEVLT